MKKVIAIRTLGPGEFNIAIKEECKKCQCKNFNRRHPICKWVEKYDEATKEFSVTCHGWKQWEKPKPIF